MVSATLTEVVIFDEHLYRPTGLVGFWMNKVTTRFGVEARAHAPVDTGELVAGISTASRQIGVRLVQGTITSNAPHTMWVIRGTGFPVKGHEGRIYTTKGFVTRDIMDAYVSLWGVQRRGEKFTRKGRGDRSGPGRRQQHLVRKKGYWLRLPFPSRGGGPIMTFSVRGQEPNNFLYAAWRATARTHSAIGRRGAAFPEL